jgi:hypothetical protein
VLAAGEKPVATPESGGQLLEGGVRVPDGGKVQRKQGSSFSQGVQRQALLMASLEVSS